MSYTDSCVCGKSYTNNCAHYLSNWMINNNVMSKNPGKAYCCDSGRPIRAKEMRDVFTGTLGLTKSFNPPKSGGNCYIYCEDNNSHQGHVYYGTKSNCVAGTGSGTDFGMDYFEYYT